MMTKLHLHITGLFLFLSELKTLTRFLWSPRQSKCVDEDKGSSYFDKQMKVNIKGTFCASLKKSPQSQPA